MKIKKHLISISSAIVIWTILILLTPVGEFITDKREEIKYTREIKKNPEKTNPYTHLIGLYLMNEEYEKALNIKKKRLDIAPAKADFMLSIASMYTMLLEQNPRYEDSARKYLNKALAYPDSAYFNSLGMIGNIYYELGEDSLALVMYKRELSRFIDDTVKLLAKSQKKSIMNRIKKLKKEINVKQKKNNEKN